MLMSENPQDIDPPIEINMNSSNRSCPSLITDVAKSYFNMSWPNHKIKLIINK